MGNILYFNNMFRDSKPSKEQDLFKGVSQQMTGRKLQDLTDEKAWQNVFYNEVTSKIDEKIFKPIYASKMGRPNASLRILASMIILKEGQDWTDEQLYENCRFNLAVMRALGLTNIDDEVPVASTYYDFKSRLVTYYEDEGKNLFEELFGSITTSQIEKYKINGTSIRMDSKLIQSNIGTYSRLHKIVQAFQTFYGSLDAQAEKRIKGKTDRGTIKELMSKPVTNHMYKMSSATKSKWLRQLGFLIRKLLNIYKEQDSKYYNTLKQMYEQQYEDQSNKQDPEPKDKGQMQADSIQSIHDPDAAYRVKGHGEHQQKVSGYSSNITETTEGPLNLITDVQVEKATYSDDQYLQKATENSEELSDRKVEQIHTDGGYDSHANRLQFKEWGDKEWHLAKMKGGPEYKFRRLKNGTLKIYDAQAKKWRRATVTKSGKYRIEVEGRATKYRYFKQQRVEATLALQEVMPKQIDRGKRATAESTINQVFHILRAGKSKYRGLMRHKIFVTSRCLWVNCQRIVAIDISNYPILQKARKGLNLLSNRINYLLLEKQGLVFECN